MPAGLSIRGRCRWLLDASDVISDAHAVASSHRHRRRLHTAGRFQTRRAPICMPHALPQSCGLDARWWAATVDQLAKLNMIKVVVGFGVLTLPSGMERLSDNGMSRSVEAKWLALLLLVIFAMLNSWTFVLIGEACERRRRRRRTHGSVAPDARTAHRVVPRLLHHDLLQPLCLRRAARPRRAAARRRRRRRTRRPFGGGAGVSLRGRQHAPSRHVTRCASFATGATALARGFRRWSARGRAAAARSRRRRRAHAARGARRYALRQQAARRRVHV